MKALSHWMREARRSVLLVRRRCRLSAILFLAFAAPSFAQTTATSSQTAQSDPVLQYRSEPPTQIPGSDAQDLLTFIPGVATTLPPPVDLVLPTGVPLRVILKKPLRIQRVGEPVQAFVTEPVYAFDRVVIPEGSEVDGRITALDSPAKLKRTESYLNADFSAHRVVHLQFDTLILSDGARRPIDTLVLPTLGPVLRLETNAQSKNSTVRRAKGLIRQQWDMAKAQLKPSAMWHLVKSFASSELPYHKQKLSAGTVFDIELEQPLDFGLAVVPPLETGAMGQLPEANSNAFARLTTYLSSATAHVGMPVEAILTRPVFSPDGKLLLPVGTALSGIVVRARPARRMHRNGQLHFTLQRVQLPDGVPQQVEMALSGIEVPKASRIQLDSEGTTSVTGNKDARVLTTALSVVIATSTLGSDHEHGGVDPNGDPTKRAVAGGSSYKLLGAAIGFAAKSTNLARVMGFWGAGQSVYSHFFARGSDLVLAKGTPIEISFGLHRVPSNASVRAASPVSAGDQ
ncbi:MAG TPA: hypothetical protein VGR72_09055 [Candidatus Acidoferrales bacterium]|nr:hypothetical protein [Candidatus Acidoferrales bacterium]